MVFASVTFPTLFLSKLWFHIEGLILFFQTLVFVQGWRSRTCYFYNYFISFSVESCLFLPHNVFFFFILISLLLLISIFISFFKHNLTCVYFCPSVERTARVLDKVFVLTVRCFYPNRGWWCPCEVV